MLFGFFVSGLGLCATTPSSTEAQGWRVDGGLIVVRPEVRGSSAEVFAAIGGFRAGLGVGLETGYDVGRYGASVSFGFAGVDVGEPFSRGGIDMGRQQALYSSAALTGHWRTAYEFRRWRPMVSIGYVRSALGEILLAGDSLPQFARSLGGPAPDTVRRPIGVTGSGLRVGIAVAREISARDFSGRMALNIGATVDAVRYGELTYGAGRMSIPGPIVSVVPRLHVAVWWSPRAHKKTE